MDVFEAIRTTRAMRRLDPGRPVPDEAIWTIIEAATKAPSGSNAQPTRWLVIRDADTRRALAEIYHRAWQPVAALYAERMDDPDVARMVRSANHLADHMADVPVLIVPCGPGGDGGSVYPGCQNLFLAARALGLGTALTTVHRREENAVRELLGIPAELTAWAVIPLGYPLGRWGEAKRLPPDEVAYWDHWGATRSR